MAYKCHHRKPTCTLSEIFFAATALRKKKKRGTTAYLHSITAASYHTLLTCVCLAGGELCVLAPPPRGPHYTAGCCECDCREPPASCLPAGHCTVVRAPPTRRRRLPALHFKKRASAARRSEACSQPRLKALQSGRLESRSAAINVLKVR